MSKKNYKEYADFGVQQIRLVRQVTVLDTLAESNFFHVSKVPEDIFTRRIGFDQNSSDENGHLVKISGTIYLFLRFGTYEVKTYFCVCERLATQ